MESGSWMLPGDSGRIAGIKGRMLPDPAALPSRLLRTLVLTLLAAMAWASAEGAEARNFGTIPVGTTSPALCVTFLFTTEGTLGSKPAVVTQGIPDLDFKLAEGGTLGAGFRCHPGQSGTVKVTFTPQHPGPRYGAVNLADASGNLMATVCLQGAGSGPQVAFLPGVATRIGSGFCVPIGVAVDAGGNVFLADTYNNRVVKATPSGGTYTQTTAVSGSFRPVAIALDGGGNLYIYDTAGDDYDGRILKETLSEGRYTETIVASRCGQRGAMAVDADGNLCVADTDHGKVVKYTLANGAYTRTELASGFADPNAIAVDASGNLYFATDNETLTKLDVEHSPGLDFGMVPMGSTATRSLTLTNNGNADLVLPAPASGSNPTLSGAGYTWDSTSTWPMVPHDSGPGLLAAGKSATMVINFNPLMEGAPQNGCIRLQTPSATRTVRLEGGGACTPDGRPIHRSGSTN
jgi:streptogramin lyase